MLHEVLLALIGHTGGIFVNSDGVIKPLPVPFLHPGELSLLNELCHLGTTYCQIRTYISKYNHDRWGLYMQAFCRGLDQLLIRYTNNVTHLEGAILDDPNISLTRLQHELREYQLLFPAVLKLLEAVGQSQSRGCQILNLISKATVTGVPCVKEAMSVLFQPVSLVLYKQLSVWMIYGELVDDRGEFFVHRLFCGTGSHGDGSGSSQSEADDGIVVATPQVSSASQTLPISAENALLAKFSLRAEMLPSFIPVRVATKIIFIGESVDMFQRSGRSSPSDKKSVLEGREDEFSQILHDLYLEPFNIMSFEGAVDRIRDCVAESLWKLVVEDGDLVSNLRLVKDFYLLGRGELFLSFIEKADKILSVPPLAVTPHDVNMAFQQAARAVMVDDESLRERFKLSIKGLGGSERAPADRSATKHKASSTAGAATRPESGWKLLRLEFRSKWPLHIFFSQASMERYNTIFQLLLEIRRVQLTVHNCWRLHMDRKGVTLKSRSPREHRSGRALVAWQLLTHLAFFVDNLQYYLQVDVIESQYGILVKKLTTTRDFEAIQHAHSTYLTTLMAQCFLLVKQVPQCLDGILKCCLTFCKLMEQYAGDPTEEAMVEVEEIRLTFQRQTSLLFKLLGSMKGRTSGSAHLTQFFLRIDFNRYFSNCGGQLGGPTTDGFLKS